MSLGRRVAAAVTLGMITASLVVYLTGEPSTFELALRVGMILFWFPLKGALLRFLGGQRAYRGALAANASSELTGLAFSLSRFGVPWPALTISFVASIPLEALALFAVGTAALGKSFVLSVYANIVVHVLTAGLLLWTFQPGTSVILFVLGFALFILPIFVVDRPLGGSGVSHR